MVLSVINTTQVALLVVLRYVYSRTQPGKVISKQVDIDLTYPTILKSDKQWLEDTQPNTDKVLN